MEERSLLRPRSTPSIPAPLSLIRPSACAGATWLPTLARTAADSGPHGCRLWPARLVVVQALPRRGAHALPPLCRSSIRVESQVHQSGVPSPSGWSCKFCWADDRCACRHRSFGDKTGAGRGREQRADRATRVRSSVRTGPRTGPLTGPRTGPRTGPGTGQGERDARAWGGWAEAAGAAPGRATLPGECWVGHVSVLL